MQLVFVCTGNICRSPMAEIIVRDALEERGLDSVAKACSRGLGGWHVGQGADERAVAQLCSGGHDGASHRAAQLGEADLCADAFIAMDAGHKAELLARGIDPARVFLLRSFDPHSPEGAEVEDPYYGSDADFARTRREIEAAVPGLLDWVSLHKD
ncbi:MULTISPECIES: low molecular weight protein-tyrosine-phosphatase [Corynebacterium]|uniref:low molecular weight protein-tyrosine-phosphatase n=1 Tax=Corynebacterium TaxID=1716 RepID=UPI000EE88340|nr:MULTISPECIES: low molecular weight protein-tyrosine-phosphatase [Corynebacterium]MDN6100209.1 low molecular weight phosphotyrosine protein phosphatase [Corynebacterium flavescens]MDN6200328.1 low molecular weight phosphotyrosine protein phosphatase [Corynebacterium flavescens]MDN6227030.1 low molecular weight phosphotyrosine protein phosphatase [Corynebacterium flavescens]MDN6430308.1 low molecular weight phosphotyrosine protein phosphatase [Corynebacterium flavescens]MDN6474276.1 low molec